MKAVVTYQQVCTAEVYLAEDDMIEMVKAGVDTNNGLAVAEWLEKQSWLSDELQGNQFESYAPDPLMIEIQDDEGWIL